MNITSEKVAEHYVSYGEGALYDRIIAALERSGVSENAVEAKHLKAVDEFHIGGAGATEALLDPLEMTAGTRILDIGSGIGGPARLMADRYGAEVTGIDLTHEFVATAGRLGALVGLNQTFVQGSALDLPFEAGSFDLATLLHVGMNLPDKARLFAEVSDVLAPNGTFAVYDVMLFGQHPAFPLPWASTPEESFLESPETYLAAAHDAGFTLSHRQDRGDVARAFFADLKRKLEDDGPPVVGLPIIMGPDAATKVANMIAGVASGAIQPVEMIFRKA